MEFYSQSLCFAELGTNNVSFAYLNRATCYLKLKRYDECLRDIELAERANYPHMAKLMQRKADCERLMQGLKKKNKIDGSKLKIDFNPNEKFPCMADVLEIKMNEEFGRHVIANRDIDVGKTVLVEKYLISVGHAPDRVQCYNCATDEANFIACPTCTDVMFCKEEIRHQSVIHRKFCGSTTNRIPCDIRSLVKSLLLGINEFSSASEMMHFVEDTLAKQNLRIPDAINNSRTRYSGFLSLQSTKRDIDLDQVYKTFTGILVDSIIKAMFASEHSRRFLMHLCAAHWSIVNNNSFSAEARQCYRYGNAIGTAWEKLGIVTLLFNHACAPNLFNFESDDTELFITTRSIKKGEQLFVSYFHGTARTRERQTDLLRECNFLCKCDKCVPHCPAIDREKMKSDENFKFLKSVSNQNNISTNVEDKCVEFLQKFGHLSWSEEMDYVLTMYKDLLYYILTKSL